MAVVFAFNYIASTLILQAVLSLSFHCILTHLLPPATSYMTTYLLCRFFFCFLLFLSEHTTMMRARLDAASLANRLLRHKTSSIALW